LTVIDGWTRLAPGRGRPADSQSPESFAGSERRQAAGASSTIADASSITDASVP